MISIRRILKEVVLPLCAIALSLAGMSVYAQEVRTYLVSDLQGSPVIATDAYANVTWSEDYLPYGERRYRSANSGDNERWFTGAAQNEDTGLVDLGNRYYDPMLGRFLSVDPVGASGEKPFSVNRYAYSNNNPYRYIDPQGNVPLDTIWDVGSVIYDLGKVTVGWTIGNQVLVAEGLTDAAVDTAAMAIPYFPAGSTKLARMTAKQGGKTLDEAVDAARGGSAFAREAGILRDAARGKGNFGLGSSTRAEAERLGRAWVGDGYKVASDGKTLISADKLRQFRPPSMKPNLGIEQANFEQRVVPQGQWSGNGHLDVGP